MTQQHQIEQVKVDDLHFDRSNPRLVEYGIGSSTTDDEILTLLWEAMDVRELVLSISASGFFPHEALIAAREDNRCVVIEGNRRLAALKVLRSDTIAKANKWEVPIITPAARKELEMIPIIFASRKESWRYLGFKHVNGPAKWTSYAKAAYIGEVHRSYRIPLADIAQQIGDEHQTVQRLYRSLMVLEQAEREKVWDREDRFRQRLAFSHLYTGLDYIGISAFLDVAPKEKETDSPVPKGKLKELGELCVWLYGSKRERKPPVVESQNPHLRQLNAVVSNRESIAALRAGEDLAHAFEISRPSDAVFEDALFAAKRELTTARANLTSGYDRSEALLRIAGTIANIAEDIYHEMERKHRGDATKPKRMTEE